VSITLLSRRTIIASAPASLLGGALFAHAQSAGPPVDYSGAFRIADDHHLGIERFFTDDGEVTLLFADYKTSSVRRLFPISESEFVFGPTFGKKPEIDTRRIGFWGSSEGGMLAIQAAARERDVAFAINSSGFMGPLSKTLRYQTGAIMRANGKPAAEIVEAEAFTQLWMDVARTGRAYDEFLSQRQTLIAGHRDWPTYTAMAFSSLAQMRWAWRRILSFDSLPALRRIRCPVLGVFGEHDVYTDANTASAAMRGTNPLVTTHIFADASHSLMATSREGMAPGVFSTLRSWIAAHI
jgi:hypothetical protein